MVETLLSLSFFLSSLLLSCDGLPIKFTWAEFGSSTRQVGAGRIMPQSFKSHHRYDRCVCVSKSCSWLPRNARRIERMQFPFYVCVVTTMIMTSDSRFTDLSCSRCPSPDEHITVEHHETIRISMIIFHGVVIIRLVSLCLSLLLWLLFVDVTSEKEREREIVRH